MTQGMSLNDENVKAWGGYTVLMKLPAHRAGLPEEEVSFILCPLTPPTRRGLRGTFRPKGMWREGDLSCLVSCLNVLLLPIE